MKKLMFLPVAVSVVLASCNGGGNPASETVSQESEAAPEKTCVYSYNNDDTEVLWVAYKYTEKVGVKGVFDEFEVMGTSESNTPSQVLAGAEFKIPTESVNSGDATRDPKIREYFFGKLQNGQFISGKVLSLSGDQNEGKANLEITMNSQTHPVEGTYSVINEKLEVKANISVATWAANEALGALNKVCEDLHKGADGASILWPDVSLFISTKLTKTCN